MITLAPNGDVLVGGTGYVAFSKDAGATFSRTKVVVASKAIHVIADDDYATNNIIYATTPTAIYRGKADTTTGLGPYDKGSFESTMTVSGLAQVQEVTYVLTSNGTNSRLSHPG